MFEKSIMVIAHPDDEVLWFSSLLDKVDEVVICYLENKSVPALGGGRKKSLSEHPIKNIRCLEINSAGVFNTADWNNPEITRFGINLSKQQISNGYEDSYYKLKERLQDKLQGYRNVFTHNPWGEYGHEEHVQVYRIISELREKLKFNLRFSNYCSNRSFNLMLRYISGFSSEYITLKTNKGIGNQVMGIYKENSCWTWYDDWEWFNDESFMQDIKGRAEEGVYGHIFPLNMIKMDYSERLSKSAGQTTLKSFDLCASLGNMLQPLKRRYEKTN